MTGFEASLASAPSRGGGMAAVLAHFALEANVTHCTVATLQVPAKKTRV